MLKKIKRLMTEAAVVSSLMIPVTVKAEMPESDPALTQDLTSDYAIVLDSDTGQILSEKNADEKMYPASMTKMMTALVAIEQITDPNETVTITSEMLKGLTEANASVAGFMAGDAPTMLDLLYGVALPSGADASNAFAFHFEGSVEAYVEKMNQKAREIGMENTHFANTTGLHREDHYSTVRDMAKLLKYCLGHETFRTIFSQAEYTSTPLASHPAGLKMSSTVFSAAAKGNYSMPGFIGGKTGYTGPAGHCLAYWAWLNDMNLIIVTAHAATGMYVPSHIKDASVLLTKLNEWEKRTLLKEGDIAAEITVKHAKKEEKITIDVKDTLIVDLPKSSVTEFVQTFPQEIRSDVEDQDLSGTIAVTMDGNVIYQRDLMVVVPREPSFFSRLWMRIKKLFGF